jgi:L-rhamnose mutarotase
MPRIGFTLQVKPELIDEYRRHHAAVWPEMLDALRRCGWGNYSLFLRADGTLFGYVEVPGTFDEARAAMDAEPVNARWQALMAPFFEGSGRPADQLMQPLEEVFHLDASPDAGADSGADTGPGPPA